ncbi:hypothetical protein [Salmonella enterica]
MTCTGSLVKTGTGELTLNGDNEDRKSVG